jgi:methyl-accepting chemotaxis protein
MRNLTFGQKIGAGFALIVLLAAGMGACSVVALRSVVASKDRVIAVNARRLLAVERLQTASEWRSAASRGFLLMRDERFLQSGRDARQLYLDNIEELRSGTETVERREQFANVERAESEYDDAVERVIALRKTDATLDAVVREFDELVLPKRDALRESLRSFARQEEQILEDAMTASTATASSAITIVVTIAVVVAALALLIGYLLTMALTRQIGTAVSQVRSAAAELQAAANQQATGAREQATAMNEISTTIRELLATSNQIAEGSQRVTQIAEDTAGSADAGDLTVERAHESISAIRRQVDLVVNHMLDLGRKSQQIGAVVDIVSELAEQTNILAINATIEAAGAGDSGKRFAVVADEIRKLADRVTGSAKEIRGLVDDVRSAVNTTVMATETGSKSVESGSKQFGEVAASFKKIGELVSTTTEAAREIGLSTKQQATAVEQVNVAISNVAQATRETETSSAQTLQTASQLAGLSNDLLRLVKPQPVS